MTVRSAIIADLRQLSARVTRSPRRRAAGGGHTSEIINRATIKVDAPSALIGECKPMRCAACGEETILVKVVRDDSMAVLGFEHHTSRCPECRKVERCLVFTRYGREVESEPLRMGTAPPIVPPPAVQGAGVAAPGFFRRVIAKMRVP
jgi:hypothetical protein